ncbi:hypothetical protein [Candidatus Kryptonium thompsonii]|nr:hypothetical protein [Candidatus Kryptonium thompsoni]
MKGKILTYFILIIGAFVFAYPFLWMVFATLKPEFEIADIWFFFKKYKF